MATTQIPWGDGSNDKLYFEADSMVGNQTVAVSSDPNSGASERSKIVNFNASGVQPQPLQIVQLGSGGIDFDAWLKDGDTHLWINILNDYQLDQQIRIRMIGTIDWGDGSEKVTANVTEYTTFTHTYTQKGKYRIDLHPTSGTFYLGGGNTTYNVMGTSGTNNYWRAAALYQVEIGSSIITAITMNAFAYCYGLQRIYIPKTITELARNMFYVNSSLREIIFEDETRAVTSNILNQGLYYCYSLQSISGFSLGGGTLMSATFRNCYCLNKVTIPSTITDIAANTFALMYGLKDFYCLPTTPPTVAAATAFSNLPADCVIYVPIGSLSAYQAKQYWSSYSSQMVEAGAIKLSLTNVSIDNRIPMVRKNNSYTATLTPDSGTLGTVTVKMGGVDVTNTVYSNGVITIASVTGNIEITATAA